MRTYEKEIIKRIAENPRLAVPAIKFYLNENLNPSTLSVFYQDDEGVMLVDESKNKNPKYMEAFGIRYANEICGNELLFVEKYHLKLNSTGEVTKLTFLKGKAQYLFLCTEPKEKIYSGVGFETSGITEFLVDVNDDGYTLEELTEKKLWILMAHRLYDDMCCLIDENNICLDCLNSIYDDYIENFRALKDKYKISNTVSRFVENVLHKAITEFVFDFAGKRIIKWN